MSASPAMAIAIASLVPSGENEDSGHVAVVGWGSTYGPISRAVSDLRAEGKQVSHIHLRHIYPFAPKLAPYCGTDMAAPADFDTSCATPNGGDILCNTVVSDGSAQGCATDGSQICDARWPLGTDLEGTREWYTRSWITDPGYKCRDGLADAGCGNG